MDMPMHGDATLLKEKIIKTDTLLKKYQENLTKLKKATELCKYLKKNYEDAKQTLEITQLENDRTKFKLENIHTEHQKVEVENKRLSSELSKLEEQYQKYNLDAQSTIQNLQHELRLMQELKSSPDANNKIKSLEGKLKKLHVAEKSYKAEIDRLNTYQNEIYEKHKTELSNLLEQIENTKSQVNSKDVKCHTKPDPLNDNINSEAHLNIIQNKSEYDSDGLKVIDRSLLKALNDLQLANKENTILKQQLNIKNREIAALKIKKPVKSVFSQTNKIADNLKDTTCYTDISNGDHSDLSDASDLDVIHDYSRLKQQPLGMSFKQIRNQNNRFEVSSKLNGINPKSVKPVPSHSKAPYETQKKLSTKIPAIYVVPTQTECFDNREFDDSEVANAENIELEQQLNKEVTALTLNKPVESVYVQTKQISDNIEGKCYTENHRDYFPDSSSESDFGDIHDIKQQPLKTDSEDNQNQNNIDIEVAKKQIEEILHNRNGSVCKELYATKNLTATKSAINNMSSQTDSFYTEVKSGKPETAVISTQTTIKHISLSTQTEYKYISQSTQTDSINENDIVASDEYSISDILTEMKNIPRLLSPISDVFEEKLQCATQSNGKKNISLSKRNPKRRIIWTNRSNSPKYVPWKRRMLIRKMRSEITQDSVTKALQILKKSNINFTISNESILPQGIRAHPGYYCEQLVMPQNQQVCSTNTGNNFTEKLSCCFSSCVAHSTHMMLNDRGECPELLGFFNGERESTMQTNGNIATLSIHRTDSHKPKADLVDETAKIVISKLKKEFNLIPKKRRRRNLSSSGSEISEFEKDGLSAKRSTKKTKWLHRQTEETTSGFESSSTPLSQCSTMNSQKFGFEFNGNDLQTSQEGFSFQLQNNETPLSPSSDIIIFNQLSELNVSLEDYENQKINQYNEHSGFHMNEEVIDCNMKKVLGEDKSGIYEEKSDFKIPKNKYEVRKISTKDIEISVEKTKRKRRRQPISKLKSKTLRQFKEKRLIFQPSHSNIASVCNGTIENKCDNGNLVRNKLICKATINEASREKSSYGKQHNLMETELDITSMKEDLIDNTLVGRHAVGSKIVDSSNITRKFNKTTEGKHVKSFHPFTKPGVYSIATEVEPIDEKSKSMSLVDTPNLQISNMEFECENRANCENSFKIEPSKENIASVKDSIISGSDTNVKMSNTNTSNLMPNRHITRNRSKISLTCDEQLKNCKQIDLLQDLSIIESVKECIEPQSKLLKANALKKFESGETSNTESIHPDTDALLTDLITPKCGRRRSQRLILSGKSNGDEESCMTMANDRESLTFNEKATETSKEYSGTVELGANVNMKHEVNSTDNKNDFADESTNQKDLPHAHLCNFIDTPASPEPLPEPEPEDYHVKIIPLDPIENQDGKRSQKATINRKATKKNISVIQNIIINSSNNTSMNENGDVLQNFGSCDILSMILRDMDKSKGSSISKNDSTLFVANKNPHTVDVATTNYHKLEDKRWRSMILDVAELIHCDEDILNFDLQTYESQIMPLTYLRKYSLLEKANILIRKLKVTKEGEKIRDELILEFRRFSPETVVNIILHGLIKDTDKKLGKYHPLLLVTKMQWQFIKLMIQLEQEKMKNIFELYLQMTEIFLCRKCSVAKVLPLTRLYVAVCKLHGDVNRVRKLCCEAFYYTADLAVILLFTVLTSWIEIFPMQDNLKCFPVAAVMAQLIHLKNIKSHNFKLGPLKMLLNQHYGYPKERLNCDEFFQGLVESYLRNPSRMMNFAIRLYCKYKNNDWLKKKINQIFKPLVYKIPVDNENFKATVIILLANICEHLQLSSTNKYMVELKAWFSSLSEGDTPEVIQHSVEYALNKLSITKPRQIKGKKAKAKKNSDSMENVRK